MVTETRSEKLKKAIRLSIVIAAIYTVVVFIGLFFIMAWSWGEKKNVLQETIIFLMTRPFQPAISLWLIPLNGLIWGAIISILRYSFVNK